MVLFLPTIRKVPNKARSLVDFFGIRPTNSIGHLAETWFQAGLRDFASLSEGLRQNLPVGKYRLLLGLFGQEGYGGLKVTTVSG